MTTDTASEASSATPDEPIHVDGQAALDDAVDAQFRAFVRAYNEHVAELAADLGTVEL